MRGPIPPEPASSRQLTPSLPMVTALACGFFLASWAVSLFAGSLLPNLPKLFDPGTTAVGSPADSGLGAERRRADGRDELPGTTPPVDPFLASGLYGMEPAAGPGEDGSPHADGSAAAEAGTPSGLAGLADRIPEELTDVAARLAEKERRLEARRRELEVEEEVLTKLRDDLDGQLARLEELKQEIAGLLEQVSAEEEARLAKLVAIYEAMKPKQAAAIFDRLELPVLLKVTQRMRETKLAPILARMDPARARQITTELSASPELPAID